MKLKDIDLNSIEIQVDVHDRSGDGALEAYITYAEDKQGDMLTEDQLDVLNNNWDTMDYISDLYYRGEV